MTKNDFIKDLPVSQLHREIAKRQLRSKLLLKKRKNLELRIARLDAKLAFLSGSKKTGRKSKAK